MQESLAASEFLMAKLPVGFATAVLPVSAETITADTSGLEDGEVSIPTADRQIPGYRAMPKSGKSFPIESDH